MNTSNRTKTPSTADRVFVADLVDRLGLAQAAEQLGLSKLATLGVVNGRGVYSPTIQSVQHARARMIA
jgi:hypothetical protein